MITVMDRFEQKYFISENEFNKLIKKLDNHLEKDKYYKETIYNLYFDSENKELINRSMDKPIYKEKIRARSYEVPSDQSMVFLEIKKKFNGNTNKRRILIKYCDLIEYLNSGIIPNANKQIMNEIDYCFKKYNLKPTISITYNRLSYYLKNDRGFRITFDNNIKYTSDKLKLDKISDENILFESGYIMEIKTQSALPLWFSKTLNDLKIYPISYSKICKIYNKLGGEYV